MIPRPPNNRKIKRYRCIDHCGKGSSWTEVRQGREYWGIPYGEDGDNSQPYIEIREGKKVVRTVNINDVAEIEFDFDD